MRVLSREDVDLDVQRAAVAWHQQVIVTVQDFSGVDSVGGSAPTVVEKDVLISTHLCQGNGDPDWDVFSLKDRVVVRSSFDWVPQRFPGLLELEEEIVVALFFVWMKLDDFSSVAGPKRRFRRVRAAAEQIVVSRRLHLSSRENDERNPFLFLFFCKKSGNIADFK